jgi:hypothetical protein
MPDAGTGDYTSSFFLLVYISVPEHIRNISALAYHLWDLGAQLGRVSFNFVFSKTNQPRKVMKL